MPEMPRLKMAHPGWHLVIGLLLVGLFYALGNWAVRNESFGWTIFAMAAIVFAWFYAGMSWLQWVKLRQRTPPENR